MPIIDDLFVRLGYEADQEKIDDFNDGIEASARLMRKAALSSITAATAIGVFVGKMSGLNNELNQAASNLRIPKEMAQAWRDAADDLGVGADKAISLLGSLAKVEETLAAGKGLSGDFLEGLSRIDLNAGDLFGLDVSEIALIINKGLQKLKGNLALQAEATDLLGIRDSFNLIANPELAKSVQDNFRELDLIKLDKVNKKFKDFEQASRDAALVFANAFSEPIGNLLEIMSDQIKAVTSDIVEFNEEVDKKGFGQAAVETFSRDILGGLVSAGIPKGFIDSLIPSATDLIEKGANLFSNPSGLFSDSNSQPRNVTNTIENNIKMDIVSPSPIVAGKEAERVMENANKKALTNLETLQAN